MEPRKRSNVVALTLIGLPIAAIAIGDVIPPPQQIRRNLYPDRAACERDYSPAQCQPNSGSSGSGGTGYGGGWRGPYYTADRNSAAARSDPGPGRTGQVTRTEASTRGGFGAFGRAMRAVG